MLDVVDEEAVADADDRYADAANGQDSAEQAAALAAEDLMLAQTTVLMTNSETRLQERDVAVQAQLQSQLEALVNKQEQAHERMLLTFLRCPHRRMQSMRVSSSRRTLSARRQRRRHR